MLPSQQFWEADVELKLSNTVGWHVRGLFSAKMPDSSFAEVRMGLLPEPTHMEDENEEQKNEKEDAKLRIHIWGSSCSSDLW